jgi:hypothetical protein
MLPAIQSVWVQLGGEYTVIVGGVYREHRLAASAGEHRDALNAIGAR